MTSIRERNPAWVGLVGLVVVAVVAVATFYSEHLPVVGGGTSYTARFTEAAGLRTGNEVRVAGVRVGRVTEVALAGDHVDVTFSVEHTWIGDASTVAIKIRTLLGAKYLAVDPRGEAEQDADDEIPVTRTTSPYDVTEALDGLAETVDAIDTDRLARSFEAISETFSRTPPQVRAALEGLSSLSKTIHSRDRQLAGLLANTRKITATLSGEDGHIRTLLSDGNLLLSEVRQRRDAIRSLLTGTRALSGELSGLVADNQERLGPTLAALDQVTDVLVANQANLDRALALAGPYYRLVGNTLGNGRWFDSYLCGLVPNNYLPPGSGPASGCLPPKGGR